MKIYVVVFFIAILTPGRFWPTLLDMGVYMFVQKAGLQQDNSAVIKLTRGAGAGARIWADTLRWVSWP